MGSSTAVPSPWRNRDLVLVLVGGTVNNVGDWMLLVALPVYVYVETGSGLATAAVFLIELMGLKGRARLDVPMTTLLGYEGG